MPHGWGNLFFRAGGLTLEMFWWDVVKTVGPVLAGISYLVWNQITQIKVFTEDARKREDKCDARYDKLDEYVKGAFTSCMMKNNEILSRIEDRIEKTP